MQYCASGKILCDSGINGAMHYTLRIRGGHGNHIFSKWINCSNGITLAQFVLEKWGIRIDGWPVCSSAPHERSSSSSSHITKTGGMCELHVAACVLYMANIKCKIDRKRHVHCVARQVCLACHSAPILLVVVPRSSTLLPLRALLAPPTEI